MLCIIYKESLTNGYRIHTYIIHAVEPPKIMYIILCHEECYIAYQMDIFALGTVTPYSLDKM